MTVNPMRYQDVREALKQARNHVDLVNGYPSTPSPGECEVCDILWLLDNAEGEEDDSLFALRDIYRDAT